MAVTDARGRVEVGLSARQYCPAQRDGAIETGLLQPHVLRLGLLQDGDVGIKNNTMSPMATPDQARRSPGCLHSAPPRENRLALDQSDYRPTLARGGCPLGLPPSLNCDRQS